MSARIGWLGLGAMGSQMALRAVDEGHDVTAYDIDPSRGEVLAGRGVHVAASAASAVANVDVLAVTVATPQQGEAALFESGAVAALRPGAVVLCMATVGPDAARSWATRTRSHDVDLVDAPVSGGVERARNGELLMMVSGAPDAVRRVEPLVTSLSSNASTVGSQPGDGQKFKLVNQLLCGVHIAVAAEALAFAEALGIDARECWEVVRRGAGASFMLDNRGDRMLRQDFADVASALSIFVKDMSLVTQAAEESGFSAPLTATASALFDAGREMGLANRDDAALIEVLRGRERGWDSNDGATA